MTLQKECKHFRWKYYTIGATPMRRCIDCKRKEWRLGEWSIVK